MRRMDVEGERWWGPASMRRIESRSSRGRVEMCWARREAKAQEEVPAPL